MAASSNDTIELSSGDNDDGSEESWQDTHKDALGLPEGASTEGASPIDPTEVIESASRIAGSLGHSEVSVAHILLAIGQSAELSRRMQQHGLGADQVRKLCWRYLETCDWGEPNHTRPPSSSDLKAVYERANRLAQLGGAGKRSVVSLEDIVEAIVTPPLSARFVHLCYGDDAIPTAEEAYRNIASIKQSIDGSLQPATQALARVDYSTKSLSTSLQSFGTRLDNLTSVDITLAAKLEEIQKSIGSASSSGGLDAEISGFRKQLSDQHDRIESRFKSLKHRNNYLISVTVLTLILLLIAIGSGLWSVLRR